jgi:hypothetical protein
MPSAPIVTATTDQNGITNAGMELTSLSEYHQPPKDPALTAKPAMAMTNNGGNKRRQVRTCSSSFDVRARAALAEATLDAEMDQSAATRASCAADVIATTPAIAE